jgi:DNA-binding CsgD family transcriptional regulator
MGAGHADSAAWESDDHGAMDRRVRGRDRELDVVGELVGATARGKGGVLLIEGPPGIGKTRMLTETVAVARRAGLRVAAAEAFEGQRTVPFATLLTALLESEQPIWTRDALTRLRDEPDCLFWLIEELQETLAAAALERPLLVALDDLQFADAGTLVALRALVPRTAALPIHWAFALRPGESRTELRDLLSRLEDARRLRLEPLSETAVAAVVADRLDAPGEPAVLRLAGSAHGNPFLLVELLEGLREEGRVTNVGGYARVRGDELPGRLAESMRDRLDRLGADACQVVRVAAVLGQRFTADELAAVLDRRPSQLLEPIDEALRADLLSESGDHLSFRHELLREAVLRTLTRSVRRGLQREAATALIEHGAAPVQVAAALAESAEPGDEAAIEQLREAARSLSTTDAGAAADMSVRALELTLPDAPARGSLVAETLALLQAAMRDDEADALAASALGGGLSPNDEAEVRLSLSARLSGRDLRSAEENRRALRLPGLSPRLRAQHLGWLTSTLAYTGLIAEAEDNSGRALAAAGDAKDLSAAAMTMTGLVSIALHRGHYLSALEQLDELDRLAASAGDQVAARIADFQRADALAALGRLDESAELQRKGLERAERERRAWVVGGWVATAAHVHFMGGALAEARAEAEAAESLGLAPPGVHVAGAGAVLARMQVALHTGDRTQLRESLRIARLAPRDASPAVRRHAAWMLALGSGDARAAARWLADDELPYAVPHFPRDPAYQPQVARIALAAGDLRLARRASAVATGIERANPGIPLLAGLAAHTRGLVDDDPSELLRAVALLDGSQRPLVRASALEDAGRRLGDVDYLTAAFELYSAAGAIVDAERTAGRLRAHGVRQPVRRRRPAEGWESLTESELRVVRLVGSGATNRRAAERLYLSPHTVSSHLRHAFAKLQINSRVELARLLHEHDLPLMA